MTSGFLGALVGGIQSFFAGDVARAAPALRSVIDNGRRLDDPQLVVWAGAAAFFAGDERAAVELHERAAALARRAGDAAVLPFALTFLAGAQLWNGRLALAEADGLEARAADFGSRNAGDIPVDAHQLIALCAPRLTFIS